MLGKPFGIHFGGLFIASERVGGQKRERECEVKGRLRVVERGIRD